ncbi:MAG: hypothetical protein IJ019_03650 [Alphaproteobacteria bacterium]|nr:hypothetical protein [Alphaproteobacteria bacterium]
MVDNAMYDFVVNDEDEVMLLLYAGNTEPENARFVIDIQENKAELYRNEAECVVLENIPDDIFDSLVDADKLLVCEISNTENDEDSEIVFAYEADIED